jgi:uncharacterized protein YebE (UPF0316 family)
MAKVKSLAPLVLIPFLVCIAVAQDIKIISRVPNRERIAKAWNSINPVTKEYNAAMDAAEKLLHERFNQKIVVANPEEKRRETVGYYKAALLALDKEREALITLIEEEDY